MPYSRVTPKHLRQSLRALLTFGGQRWILDASELLLGVASQHDDRRRLRFICNQSDEQQHGSSRDAQPDRQQKGPALMRDSRGFHFNILQQ
jgi:hypothetical protein